MPPFASRGFRPGWNLRGWARIDAEVRMPRVGWGVKSVGSSLRPNVSSVRPQRANGIHGHRASRGKPHGEQRNPTQNQGPGSDRIVSLDAVQQAGEEWSGSRRGSQGRRRAEEDHREAAADHQPSHIARRRCFPSLCPGRRRRLFAIASARHPCRSNPDASARVDEAPRTIQFPSHRGSFVAFPESRQHRRE